MAKNNYPRLGQSGGWLARVAAYVSQGINVALLAGSPDETVSGRAYRQGVLQGHSGWNHARGVVNALIFWEEDHCLKSHQQDVKAAKTLRDIYRSIRR